MGAQGLVEFIELEETAFPQRVEGDEPFSYRVAEGAIVEPKVGGCFFLSDVTRSDGCFHHSLWGVKFRTRAKLESWFQIPNAL